MRSGNQSLAPGVAPSPMKKFIEMLRTRSVHPFCRWGGETYLSAGHLYKFLDFAKYDANFAQRASVRNRMFVLSVSICQVRNPVIQLPCTMPGPPRFWFCTRTPLFSSAYMIHARLN